MNLKYLWSPWRMDYIKSNKNNSYCVFCDELKQPEDDNSLIIHKGKFSFVIMNRFPYNNGHVMVLPYLHCSSLESLDSQSRFEMMELTNHIIKVLKLIYHPEGFNVGMNIGVSAGAGIAEHIHMHVVPRWGGDTNFMSTLGKTRVLPEMLRDSCQQLKDAWNKVPDNVPE